MLSEEATGGECRSCAFHAPTATEVVGALGRNGRISSRPGPTAPQLHSGTAFQTPATLPRGSETISRASSESSCSNCISGCNSRSVGHVGGVEKRARFVFAGVPESPDGLAVGGSDGALEWMRHTVTVGDVFDEPDRLLDGGRRVVLQTERQREVEQHLGVGLALDLGVQGRVDGEYQVAFDRGELVDVAVVHEQPTVVTEGVAVGLLHGAADRRADVGKEQRGADVAGKLSKIAVVPRRLDAVEDARVSGAPYQPTPNPSPFVVSAPSRECRLWSTNEWVPP